MRTRGLSFYEGVSFPAFFFLCGGGGLDFDGVSFPSISEETGDGSTTGNLTVL